MTATLRTANLLLHPFAPEDAPALFAFMRDSEAMQHTYIAPSLAHGSSRLSAYEAMRPALGFAPWVARSAVDNQVVGWGGLSVDPEEPEWGLEVSYAFAPAVWGRGYATELVRCAVACALGSLSAREVHAFAKPENTASARVLAKSGFSYLRFESALERNHYIVTVPNAA